MNCSIKERIEITVVGEKFLASEKKKFKKDFSGRKTLEILFEVELVNSSTDTMKRFATLVVLVVVGIAAVECLEDFE